LLLSGPQLFPTFKSYARSELGIRVLHLRPKKMLFSKPTSRPELVPLRRLAISPLPPKINLRATYCGCWCFLETTRGLSNQCLPAQLSGNTFSPSAQGIHGFVNLDVGSTSSYGTHGFSTRWWPRTSLRFM
jgi:hypothetical protein